MSKTLDKLLVTRPWIRYIDDERDCGNSIIVTLDDGYCFKDDPGCGVRGFDTAAEVRAMTGKDNVYKSPDPDREFLVHLDAWSLAWHDARACGLDDKAATAHADAKCKALAKALANKSQQTTRQS